MIENPLPLRGAWLEIDLDALANNYQLISDMVNKDVTVMPIIKADAYGHGSIRCARALLDCGAERFAVATIDEGIHLRQAGIDAPILILGYTPLRQIATAVNNQLVLTVYDLDQATAISKIAAKSKKQAFIQIKVDSGFTRLGFAVNEQAVDDVLAISKLKKITIEGVYSHFASADSLDKSFTHTQAANFFTFLDKCAAKGITFPLRHIANSAAIIAYPEYHFELCRPGIVLYGCNPSDEVKAPSGIKPVMAVKAEIARVMQVPPKTKVGYGCTWISDRDTLIATIPLGYADGISRLQNKNGSILVNGQRAPIVGRICMDQFMVDVTDISCELPLQKGDIVTIMGNDGSGNISAEELGQRMGTINYEILCMLGNRLPRIYLEKEKS